MKGMTMADLDGARNQVINTLTTWAREWYETETRDAVSAHPDVVERLAANGELTRVKAMVTNLEAIAFQSVEAHAGADAFWPHLGGAEWESPVGTAKRLPKVLDDGFRLVLGELVDVLSQYELIALQEPGGRWTKSGAGVRYGNALDLPQPVGTAIGEYVDLWHIERQSRRQSHQAERDAAVARARGLWEQA